MEIVRLEDNQEYVVLDKIVINNIKYIYLVLSTDQTKKSVCIRKLVDEEQNIAGLDSQEEYQKALQVFTNKYKNIILAA